MIHVPLERSGDSHPRKLSVTPVLHRLLKLRSLVEIIPSRHSVLPRGTVNKQPRKRAWCKLEALSQTSRATSVSVATPVRDKGDAVLNRESLSINREKVAGAGEFPLNNVSQPEGRG